MTRKTLLHKTVKQLEKLPDEKLKEVSDFAAYLAQKTADNNLVQGMENMASESNSFAFLKEEEELYTIDDLKEKY